MKVLVLLLIVFSLNCGRYYYQPCDKQKVKVSYFKLTESEMGDITAKCILNNQSGLKISHFILKFQIRNDGREHEIMYRVTGNIENNEARAISCNIKDYRDMARIRLKSYFVVYANGEVQEIYKI